ncbi:hypothetical protein H6P81_016521 [Aristolochia fimbriata]|uniref:Pentatricopeptide repeat-containing protein n=1 Tax=Aristolochia fimbriata TaxID=158543 RepID=A0AAV7EBG7_ARIFI|nr:hypothetical protein H6P81_016521 [Aristolochia fimbriata]
MSLTLSLPALSLLDGCAATGEIQQIHALTIKTGVFHQEPSRISAKIIQSCFSTRRPVAADLEYALSLFNRFLRDNDNASFFYNNLIRSHTQRHLYEDALVLFYDMLCCSPHFLPDNFTFPSVLKSCAQLSSLEEGKQIHGLILKTGIAHGDQFVGSSLIHVNALPDEALRLFLHFLLLGLNPDESTLVSGASAISALGLLNLAKGVHGYIIRHRFCLSGVLGTTLIDMHSNCGDIKTAYKIFESLPNKTVEHWTAMIFGFANHGNPKFSLQLFSRMQNSGVEPNYITFLGVLSACNHGGLVVEGLKHFNLMRRIYRINPGIEHYGCLVDLLGRMGHIEEAKMVVESMPMKPGVVIWASLLSACRIHGATETAEFAAQKLIEQEPGYAGSYVLMSDIYARLDRWEDFGRMRKLVEERGLVRYPGLSWIEVDGAVHRFAVGDKYHHRSKEIYRMLEKLEYHLKEHSIEHASKMHTGR